MSDKAKQIAIKWVTQNKEKLREISDKIWSYAELGFVEFKSSQLLADELEKQDFKVDRGVAGIPTAFVGTWGKGKPVIGVMGEYDALPGLSQKAVPYKDPIESGAPGHGCGHNACDKKPQKSVGHIRQQELRNQKIGRFSREARQKVGVHV